MSRPKIIRINEHFHEYEYSEPTRLFEDSEYFARTAPRALFTGIENALLMMAVLCAGVAFGAMVYYEFFKR